ncbi:MAG: TetR/AcrR family transcriptional regulator [Candidatus Limnocylindrales bacterium]
MKDVKSPPGSLRAERAAGTRRRIEDVARRLFVNDGYGATTLRQVADGAGVAVQTLYAVYGSKANLLRALAELVRDDPEADAAYALALAEPDRDRALALFARSIRLRWQTGHDVLTIGIEAASVDPEVRADMALLLAGRRRGIARLAQSLVGASPVPGDVARVAAVIDALTLPEIFAELAGVHGWTPDDYEHWLAASLVSGVAGR